MENTIIDDIYIYTYYDKATTSILTSIAKSIEELQAVSENENNIIMSYFNITGYNIKIGEQKIMGKLELQKEND